MNFQELTHKWLTVNEDERFEICLDYLNYRELWEASERDRFMITMRIANLEEQMVDLIAEGGIV